MRAVPRRAVVALLLVLGACTAPACDPLEVTAISGTGAAFGTGYLARWHDFGNEAPAPLPKSTCRREQAATAGAEPISPQNRARWFGEPRGG